MAGRPNRPSGRLRRGDRPGPSLVLDQRHVELPRRPDEHAEAVPDHRTRSGIAANRVRTVRGPDCNPRGPTVPVGDAYIARTGWAADAGRPRRDVRHPPRGPRGASARRVRRTPRGGPDRPDDGPVRAGVPNPREFLCRARAESEAAPRDTPLATCADRADRRRIRSRGRPSRSRCPRRIRGAACRRGGLEWSEDRPRTPAPRDPRGPDGLGPGRLADRLTADSGGPHRSDGSTSQAPPRLRRDGQPREGPRGPSGLPSALAPRTRPG